MWKEVIMTDFKVIASYLPDQTEERERKKIIIKSQ